MLKILYLILGLLGIGLIIFIHELGHFIAAKLLKVDVEVLSYGMGPRLFSFYGRKTEYRLSMIPFGGYCRMKGSLDLMKALSDDARSIEKTEAGSYFWTTPQARFLIYLAGPLMNFLLAVLLLAVLALIPVERLSNPAIVTPISAYPEVFPETVEQPSIEKGDKLVSIGDYRFLDWQDAEKLIQEYRGMEIPLTVERNGKLIDVLLIPSEKDGAYVYGITNLQEAVIGHSVSPDFKEGDRIIEADGRPVEYTLDVYAVGKEDFPITIDRDGERLERMITDGHLPFSWHSEIRKSSEGAWPLSYGIKRTVNLAGAALSALGAFITFHLEDALAVMTGPVKAAESIGGITALAFSVSGSSGMRALLLLLSIVSVSVAVGNMLPIPTFDGGQMLINIAEMIRGKALSPRSYVILQIAGMIAALLIMAAMYSLDIKAYFFS